MGHRYPLIHKSVLPIPHFSPSFLSFFFFNHDLSFFLVSTTILPYETTISFFPTFFATFFPSSQRILAPSFKTTKLVASQLVNKVESVTMYRSTQSTPMHHRVEGVAITPGSYGSGMFFFSLLFAPSASFAVVVALKCELQLRPTAPTTTRAIATSNELCLHQDVCDDRVIISRISSASLLRLLSSCGCLMALLFYQQCICQRSHPNFSTS